MAAVEETRLVGFTKTPPSPIHYHFLSPTKRSRVDALTSDRSAMVVRSHQINDALLQKFEQHEKNLLERDIKLQKLQEQLTDLNKKVKSLTDWKARVRARQLVSEYHRHSGKNATAFMLNSLKAKYKIIQNSSVGKNSEIRKFSCIFQPVKFIDEVRWLVSVQKWLDNASMAAPSMCHDKNARAVMGLLNGPMLKAVDEVLVEQNIPLDYKEAVTLYYLEVNQEVHWNVGDDDIDAVLELGNSFVSSLLQ